MAKKAKWYQVVTESRRVRPSSSMRIPPETAAISKKMPKAWCRLC